MRASSSAGAVWQTEAAVLAGGFLKPTTRAMWMLFPFLLILWVLPKVGAAEMLPAKQVEQVERLVSTVMSEQSIPALSLAVVVDNELRYSRGYGFADLENFVPAKASTVYRLGSISKPVTAVAVMQLVEQGRLDLDAPVQEYCPAFPEKRWPVTLRHLLAHLAGVRHYQGDEFASTRRYDNWADGLAIFKDDPLLHQPGEKVSYTTYGYSVLGCAVEGASGTGLMDYLRRHVFEPAGMDRIQADDIHRIIPNRTRGYQKTENGDILNADLADTSYKIPGGGLSSTVEDLARFAIALHTAKLLKPETLEQMWTPQNTNNGEKTARGLGWLVGQHNGGQQVGHGGGQQGTSTYLWMLPARSLAVVIMTNLGGVQKRPELAAEIADVVLPASSAVTQ